MLHEVNQIRKVNKLQHEYIFCGTFILWQKQHVNYFQKGQVSQKHKKKTLKPKLLLNCINVFLFAICSKELLKFSNQTNVNTHTHTQTHKHKYTHINTHTHIHTLKQIHTLKHTKTHTQSHTHTQTHTHTYTPPCKVGNK